MTQASAEKKRLGEILVERRLITPEQLSAALEYQKKDPRSLGEILHSFRLLSEEDLLKVLSIELGTEYFPTSHLLDMEISPQACRLMTREQASEFMVAPLDYNEATDTLLVAMAYPQQLDVIDRVRELTGRTRVETCLCFEGSLFRLIQRCYPEIRTEPVPPAADGDDSFFLGSEDDTEAFPGIYGHGLDDSLLTVDEENPPEGEEFFLGGEGADKGPGATSGVSGNLMDLGLLEMLQIMGASNKTCLIQIRRAEEVAELFMENGRIVHAILADLKGESAFYAVIGWSEGYFQIKTDVAPEEKTIKSSLDGLILEGLRLLDEQNNFGG